MGLIRYKKRPNEEKRLQHDIIKWLNTEKFSVITGGTLDLSVVSEGALGSKHVELKVGLSADALKFPISPKQWKLIKKIKDNIEYPFAKISRVLLFNCDSRSYYFCSLSDLAVALPKKGESTTYLLKSVTSNFE